MISAKNNYAEWYLFNQRIRGMSKTELQNLSYQDLRNLDETLARYVAKKLGTQVNNKLKTLESHGYKDDTATMAQKKIKKEFYDSGFVPSNEEMNDLNRNQLIRTIRNEQKINDMSTADLRGQKNLEQKKMQELKHTLGLNDAFRMSKAQTDKFWRLYNELLAKYSGTEDLDSDQLIQMVWDEMENQFGTDDEKIDRLLNKLEQKYIDENQNNVQEVFEHDGTDGTEGPGFIIGGGYSPTDRKRKKQL